MGIDLKLTELIDVETLQSIQDAFADMVGTAALTTDKNGTSVTKGSNFTDFCMKYTRQTELGCERCGQCDKMGAERAIATDKASVYYCHAGLVDFAAPIMVNGEMVGSFIGGQVLTSAPDLTKFRYEAEALGVDPDEYVEAVKKVRIVNKATVDKAANFLYVIANVLSNVAYQGYVLHQNNIEIEKASRAKSDFLANMSHEIRTPMNAVLGMAEMALREEMSDVARDYLHQIMSSGKNLLVIINDILDFSKIESGKMEIVEVDYEPLSVINDLCSLISTRIGEKDLEFVMDIDPNIPRKVFGDNIRIQQIMVNLLNNAVKFTKEGQVKLTVSSTVEGEYCTLHIAISDTGIGIKEEDMGKLFQSFQQVDSKRNRNIEGTGLGLAICQSLLSLMGSQLNVTSEYNVGSTFFFDIKQKIVDSAPSIPPAEFSKGVCAVVANPYVRAQLVKDLERLDVSCNCLEEPSEIVGTDYDLYFVGEQLLDGPVLDFMDKHPDKDFIILAKFFTKIDISSMPQVRLIRKPAFSLSLYSVMGLIEDFITRDRGESDEIKFTAPDANILIVDDNNINLKVASGLLEPLKMNVSTALSAKEALDLCVQKQFDIVFMDHMMPEVDGVEATHMIRRLLPSYKNTPIIALTANAIGGTKEMFLNEGMNDFVAKPIDVKEITRKVFLWLADDKIKKFTAEEAAEMEAAAEAAKEGSDDRISEGRSTDIPGLATKEALALLGSEDLFWLILEEYYNVYEKKRKAVIDFKNAEDWHSYTIEVHAIKSASRQIGAMQCGELAAALEKAGNEKDVAFINADTDIFLEEYERVHHLLDPYFMKDTSSMKVADSVVMRDCLNKVQAALDDFDTLAIDDCVAELSDFIIPDEFTEVFTQLKEAAEACDIDACNDIVAAWESLLG